jgi:hypothetical protein
MARIEGRRPMWSSSSPSIEATGKEKEMMLEVQGSVFLSTTALSSRWHRY